MSKHKFNDKHIWKYSETSYKVFVPLQLVKEFEAFSKENKLGAKVCALYNYSNDNLRLKDTKMSILREGSDFVFPKENRDQIESWMRKAYKEII